MRLIGISFAGAAPPLGNGFLPLGKITGLIGGNDAGKSRLLSLLTAALLGDRESTIFFAACNEAEFVALAEHALRDVTTISGPDALGGSGARAATRADWFDGPVAGSDLDSVRIPLHDRIQGWARAVGEAARENSDAWATIVDAAVNDAAPPPERASNCDLGSDPVVALEHDGSRGWRLFWCLPPIQELSDDLVAALGELGKARSPDDPDLLTGWTVSDDELMRRNPDVDSEIVRLVLELSDRDPKHRRLADAPIPAIPVGNLGLDLLPGPVALPLELPEAEKAITERVQAIVQRLEWADDAIAEMGEGNDPSEGVSSLEDVWLVTEGLQEGISAYAAGVLKSLMDTSNELLPDWLSERYRLVLNPSRPSRIAEDGLFLLMLTMDGASFPINDVAAGHLLWVQLALFEAAERIRQSMEYVVSRVETAAKLMAETLERWNDDDVTEYPDAETQEVLEECAQLVGHLLEGSVPPPIITTGTGADVSWITSLPEASLVSMAGVLQPRMYVIDEPERHLHPSAQRRSASWLAKLLHSHGSQALIATHAPAFMALDAAYTYALRAGGARTHLKSIEPREWTSLGVEAGELGLDRGELLTMIRVLLWVEGRHDVAVLEALFPEELRRSGIAVVPVHGYSRSSGILDAEVMLRFTAAKPAVWLDRVPQDVADALISESEAAGRILSDSKNHSNETMQAARLVLAARMQDREIEILPHPGDDVLDLVPDEIIAERYPKYPGHARVAMELQKAGLTSGAQRKEFVAEHYGLKVSPAALRDLAQLMRERGVYPPPLRELMDRCERFSRSLD